MPKPTKKKPAQKKPTAAVAATKPRLTKKPQAIEKTIVEPTVHPTSLRLSNVWELTKIAVRLVWGSKWLFLGIIFMYALLNIILAQGLSGTADVTTLKQQLGSAFHGQFGGLGTSLTVFISLIGSAGSTASSGGGSAYQILLLLLVSLALIWTLRQVSSGSQVRIRDAYYRGVYALIPLTLVLFVIALQLLPLLIGTTIYGAVLNNDLAVNVIEKIIWTLLFGAFASATVYLLSSSLFAIYIVTLPDMAPMQALRSARSLVHKRRWLIIRRIAYLPFVLIVAGAIIMVPVILVAAPIAQFVFFIITLLAILSAHAYMYTLYKDLLRVS